MRALLPVSILYFSTSRYSTSNDEGRTTTAAALAARRAFSTGPIGKLVLILTQICVFLQLINFHHI
jgi:hypothetical protein